MKPHIFIASSGDAEEFAIQLGRELRSFDRFGQVRVWCEDEFNTPGLTITEQLVQHARQCEFAVAILSQDDSRMKEGKVVKIPRDSVIFETGLFTGALDLSFERCFILCAVGDVGLPTDLKAILHIDLEKESISTAAQRISNRVSGYRPFERPEVPCISREALMYRERPEKLGGDLQDETAKVVVSARDPLEKKDDLGFLKTIIGNIELGVKYFYLFSSESPERVAAFLYRLVDTAINMASSPGANAPDPIATVTTLARNISIYMLSDRPSFEYCVHNADSYNAKCYLRYKGRDGEWRFAAMSRGDDAKAVAADLFSVKEEDARRKIPHVFRTIRGFKAQSREGKAFFSALRLRIRDRFQNISRDDAFLRKVEELCFEPQLLSSASD